MSGSLAVIVLAAGKGTRMRSALPKVLHPVCGVPMVVHVINAARVLQPDRIIVVIGYGAEAVREALAAEAGLTFVEQAEQLGTGHAVTLCREASAGCDEVMVLNGDSPLIEGHFLAALRTQRGEAPIALAACTVPDSGSFGRVTCDSAGHVIEILEGSREGPGTAERNAGQYVFDAAWLWAHAAKLAPSASGEVYLTALPAMAHAAGTPAIAVEGEAASLMGFDDRGGLAEAEADMRRRILRRHMLGGVTISDPSTTYIDADVELEQDVTVLPGTHLLAGARVAAGAVLGPNAIIRASAIGREAVIGPSVIEHSSVGDRVSIGPFCHVRGNSTIGDDCALGNYAEVNRSRLGRGVKMHHFGYLGDATVGDGANIAAGVITCNYDGVNKHPTVIGEGAFVGCDTMLVAPVTMGARSQTGAGTVLRQDLGESEVAVGVPARVIRRREG